MNNRKLNWWVIAAVLIVGIPIGFVVMGVIDKTGNHSSIEQAMTEDVVAEVIETVATEELTTPEPATEIEEQKPAEEAAPQPVPEPVVEKQAVEKPKPVELTPEQKEAMARQEAERKAAEEKARQEAEQLAAAKRKAAEEKAEAAKKAAEEKAEAAKKAAEEKARKAAEEKARKEAEQLAAAKQKAAEDHDRLLTEVRQVVTAGKSSSKVPDGCVVVVNGKSSTNYQDFRNGVKLGSYSGIKVTEIEGENPVSKIYITAKVNSAED